MPVNILNQGQRNVLPVFNELREFEQAKADTLLESSDQQPINRPMQGSTARLMNWSEGLRVMG